MLRILDTGTKGLGGILSTEASSSIEGGLPVLQGPVAIDLDISGSYSGDLITFIKERGIVFYFGPSPSAAPGTALLILLGSGFVLAWSFSSLRLPLQ